LLPSGDSDSLNSSGRINSEESSSGRYGAIQTAFTELSWGTGVEIGGEVGSSVCSGSAVDSVGIGCVVEGMGVSISATGWNGVNVTVPEDEEVDKGGLIFAGD
jgi:hypothetical protein